jgi:DNA-directed RNA polymerase specialized sigma24 family protein
MIAFAGGSLVPTPSFDDALTRIAAGDFAPLGQMVAAHGDSLRRSIAAVMFARSGRSPDPDDVEDAFSAMLEDYWVKAGEFAAAEGAAPVALLYGFARTAARRITGRAQRRRRREVPIDVAIPLPDSDGRMASPDPADWAGPVDFVSLVARAVTQLPSEMRGAVAGVHMNGWTVQQTARAMGLTEKQVSSRLVAGRAALAERLQPYRYHWTHFEEGEHESDALAVTADHILTAVMLYLGERPDVTAEEVRDHVAAHLGIRLNVNQMRRNYVRRARALLQLATASTEAK